MMKRTFFVLFAMLTVTVSSKALGFEDARREALYLTDKMAYELYLSTEQMEAVYEINLDYLMNVNLSSDLYGIYWQRRNSDLMFVLSPYQYQIYQTANYFYRPLNWIRGAWRLNIYSRYADPHLFYYRRPQAWISFRGGRNVGTRSFYQGHNFYAPTQGQRPNGSHNPSTSRRYGTNPGQGNHPNNGNYRPGQGNQPNGGYRQGQGTPQRQFGTPSQEPNRMQPSNPTVAPQPQSGSQPRAGASNRQSRNPQTGQQGQRVFRR